MWLKTCAMWGAVLERITQWLHPRRRIRDRRTLESRLEARQQALDIRADATVQSLETLLDTMILEQNRDVMWWERGHGMP